MKTVADEMTNSEVPFPEHMPILEGIGSLTKRLDELREIVRNVGIDIAGQAIHDEIVTVNVKLTEYTKQIMFTAQRIVQAAQRALNISDQEMMEHGYMLVNDPDEGLIWQKS